MGITARLPAPLGSGARSAREWAGEQPPDEISRGLFGQSRRLMRTHPLATDMVLVALLLASCSVWLAWSGISGSEPAIIQTALIIVLLARRLYPSAVFLFISAIALAQWLLGFPLLGDAALLVALYTLAAHESRIRALLATAVLEAGAAMAAVKWQPAWHGAALAAVPVGNGGGRAVRRPGGRVGEQVPGLDGRAGPQARIRAGPAGGDRGRRRADQDRQGSARHRLRIACRS